MTQKTKTQHNKITKISIKKTNTNITPNNTVQKPKTTNTTPNPNNTNSTYLNSRKITPINKNLPQLIEAIYYTKINTKTNQPNKGITTKQQNAKMAITKIQTHKLKSARPNGLAQNKDKNKYNKKITTKEKPKIHKKTKKNQKSIKHTNHTTQHQKN